jgi:5-formyltetrahydrofolate cyclo-ligase
MKKDLRQKYLARRNRLSAMEAEEASTAIKDIFKESGFSSFENVMLYKSFGREMSVDGIMALLQEKGARTYVPVVIGRHEMAAVEIDRNTFFKEDPFGIPTPVGKTAADPEKMDLILVPGIVFDTKGGRIGHGAGYYDRFLKKAVNAVKTGVSYEFQVVPELGCLDEQDVPMDFIITEKGIRNCK